MVRLFYLTLGAACFGAIAAAQDSLAIATLADAANITLVEAANITLFETVNATVADTDTIMADPPMRTQSMYQLCGVDLIGGDFGSKKAYTPDLCMQFCQETYGCNSVSWTKYEGGTCWFKNLRDSWSVPVNPNAGAISFVTRDTLMNAWESGHLTSQAGDMAGYDIMNAPAATSGACAQQCVEDGRCFAFTWSSWLGGTCWLKSRANTIVPSSDSRTTSGIIVHKTRGWWRCLAI